MTTARAPRPIEVELKYRVQDGRAGERYLEADTLATFVSASPVRPRKVEDRYVDTADGDFTIPIKPGMIVKEYKYPDAGAGLDPARPAVKTSRAKENLDRIRKLLDEKTGKGRS